MQLSPRRYRQVAVGALIALAVIIVTGAAVRLTGSGLGCDDWPRCSDTQFIDVSSKHTAIEQINRLFTGVVGFAVIAAVLGAFVRQGQRRTDLILLSLWLVVGVLANAVLGGISVKVDLHPLAVQGHLLLSMALIFVGTVLVRRAGEPDGSTRVSIVSAGTAQVVWVHFAVVCVAIVTGTLVTGAGPHAGDENAERLDLDISTVARVHAVAVLTAIALVLMLAARIRTRPAERSALIPALSGWIVVGLLQAAIGYVQYFNDVPALLVGLHVAGATAVMVASTHLVLATERPLEAVPESPIVEAVVSTA